MVRAASNPSQNPPAWWEYDVGGRAGCPPKLPQHLGALEYRQFVSVSVCLRAPVLESDAHDAGFLAPVAKMPPASPSTPMVGA